MLLDMNPRLAILGAGNMGWSVVSGALDAGLLQPAEILVVDQNPERAERARKRGMQVVSAPEAAAAEYLFVAVKPQDFAALANDLGPLPERRVIISVMAGIRSNSIRKALGPHAAVVRVMPNTPARLQAGVSVITAYDAYLHVV